MAGPTPPAESEQRLVAEPAEKAAEVQPAKDRRNWFLAGLGGLGLGVLANAIWDLAGRAGLASLGRGILWVVTLGSDAVRDSAYREAALDPTPMPSVGLYSAFIITAPFVFFVMPTILLPRILARTLRKTSIRLEESQPSTPARRAPWLRYAFGATLVAAVALGLLQMLLVTQSMQIWRVYHADLAICRPFMSSQEVDLLQSRYASMQSRLDFQKNIAATLEDVAKCNNLTLVSVPLW